MPRAKNTSTKTSNKSDFIRSQPTTLSAAEVVAKAKTAGVKILPGLVYEVRRKAKGPAKGKTKRTTTAKPVLASTTRPASSTKPPKSKAAFVRGLPASTPAKEVVKQAKGLGLSLSVNYVYNIRGAAKLAARKKRVAAKIPPIGRTNGGSWSVSEHAETLLRAVAAELGVGHAIELLHAERARVHSVLRE